MVGALSYALLTFTAILNSFFFAVCVIIMIDEVDNFKIMGFHFDRKSA